MKFADDIRSKVETKLEDTLTKVGPKVDDFIEKVEDTVTDLREKAAGMIDQKVKDGSLDASTVTIAEGAAKVTYGVLRGGFAVAGVLGHGIAGFLTRHHNPRLAAKYLKEGFESAEHSIEEGSKIFKKGLAERQKK